MSEGIKPIHQIELGDLVMASPDSDPQTPAVAKRVTRVYHNPPARLFHLHLGAEMIRVTAEHPFFVQRRGWIAEVDPNRGTVFCPG
jgi:hypothetical protein